MTRTGTVEESVVERPDSQVQDVGDTTSAALQVDTACSEQGWSAVVAFVAAPLFPTTTARRTGHLSLGRAWDIHAVSALLTVTVILYSVACKTGTPSFWDVIFEVGILVGSFLDELSRDPFGGFLAIAPIVLGVEVGFLLLALLVMPWGARDEPVRGSYRHALRQTWLRTPHVILVVFLAGATMILSAEIPTGRWNPDPLSRSPWYVHVLVAIPLYVCSGMALWLFWGLLRSVGAHRELVPIARPPTCEVCGYNLTTIPMESRCPECGKSILSSLGPDSRRGTMWQRRHGIGCFGAWAQTCIQALTQPRTVGRELQISSPGTDHRRFVALHVPLIFLIGACSIPTLYFIDTGENPFNEAFGVVYSTAPIMGTLLTLGALGLMLFAANVVGSLYSFREKRNLLPGSMQMAAYLIPYLVLWSLFGVFSLAMVFVLDHVMFFEGLAESLGVDEDVCAFTLWLVPNLVWFYGYFALLARGTLSTRYANR